ncbi:MAG: pentapeptide repeat-containing protein [Phycisphaeraceae bacterium]|nr:MAG: pentapeptide repeat-containing protein [Phycisphaeraceae bacterium]
MTTTTTHPYCFGKAPAHLLKHDWYLPHQAWLRDRNRPHHDPAGASAIRAKLRYADLRYADLSDANLSDANLRYADLSYAKLSDANLRYANLRYANLRYANLRYANLRYADLSDADLRYANLRYANLRYADLSYANLRYANLRYANLSDADLRYADLSYADLSDAKLSGAPILTDIDAKILAAIRDGGELRMSDWHACETTHCRGGWAIHLAGDAGRALEKEYGSGAAAALIYAASRPGKRLPDFYANDEDAMADIEACAAEGPA